MLTFIMQGVRMGHEKNEILVFKLGVREFCGVFKTAWEVTMYLLFSWFQKYKWNKNFF